MRAEGRKGVKARFGIIISLFCAAFGTSSCAQSSAAACQDVAYKGASYTMCKFDASAFEIRTYLNDINGAPYASFGKLKASLDVQGKTLLFAMNGGMYHNDRSSVGLYIEGGKQYQKINTNKGPGNFHMLPNGVFYMGENRVGVLESNAYLLTKTDSKYATQSGPMIVINGNIHPKFNKDSTSVHVRNGVGVKGDTIYFAISNEKVNFYNFASLFKEHLKTPNALYLDGTVSKIYAPELKRHDKGRPMGPMIAVLEEGG